MLLIKQKCGKYWNFDNRKDFSKLISRKRGVCGKTLEEKGIKRLKHTLNLISYILFKVCYT